jgi:signal peptidase II
MNGTAPETVAPHALFSVKRRFLLLSLAVLALDQWTKWLVETRIELHRSIEIVPGLFHLSHVRNTGVAFGLFAAQGEAASTWALVLAVSAVLAGVLWYFWRTPSTDRLLLAALALVLGGAVGNLIDRATTGAVTDFLAVYIGEYRWPDFNVADSAISIGITLLLLDSLRAPSPRTSPQPGQHPGPHPDTPVQG